jgi:hypothetical protein
LNYEAIIGYKALVKRARAYMPCDDGFAGTAGEAFVSVVADKRWLPRLSMPRQNGIAFLFVDNG